MDDDTQQQSPTPTGYNAPEPIDPQAGVDYEKQRRALIVVAVFTLLLIGLVASVLLYTNANRY